MDFDWRTRVDEEIKTLKQARDELRVQVHLGAADAKDRWEKLEKDWERLEDRLKQAGHAAHDSAGDVEAAAKILIGEIRTGYQHIRDAL